MTFDVEVCIKMGTFIGAALAMGLGAIGSAVGEGYTASVANEAIARNPKASGDIFNTMLVGQAVAESAAIFAMVIAMMLLFSEFEHHTLITAVVTLSAGLCMGSGAIGSGAGSGFPAGEACRGIARQPSAKNSITMNMLIGTAISQTPAIFSLVTALILLFSDFSSQPTWPTVAALLGAGIASGIGSIGSGLGDGFVASAAAKGIARQPSAAPTITKMMLFGQAVTETTAIYGLLVAFILIFGSHPETDKLAPGIALLSAGVCMGLGAIGSGIGEGITARSAVDWVSRNSQEVPNLLRMMLVGQAVAESTGIYALVVSLVLIFVA